MMTLPRCILALVLTLVLGLAGIARGQTPFHDDGYGFSLTLPKGWEVAPPEVTATAERLASQNTPNRKYRYFGSLIKMDEQGEPEGLIVLQHTPADLTKMSLKDFEREFKSKNASELTREVTSKAPSGVSNVGFDSISVDTARRRVLMTGNVTGPDGPQRMLVASHPSAGGFVQVNCYWDPKIESQMRPQMDAIVDSFAFDAGREWVPSTSSGSAYSYGRTGGMIGIGIAVLVWIGRKVAGK